MGCASNRKIVSGSDRISIGNCQTVDVYESEIDRIVSGLGLVCISEFGNQGRNRLEAGFLSIMSTYIWVGGRADIGERASHQLAFNKTSIWTVNWKLYRNVPKHSESTQVVSDNFWNKIRSIYFSSFIEDFLANSTFFLQTMPRYFWLGSLAASMKLSSEHRTWKY